MAKDRSTVWSGFWARLFASIIDFIVLGVICNAVGWLAPDFAVSLGSNGRFFGLGLGILYFSVTASGLLGGRSIGMRFLGLKVVGLNGKPLGLPAAFGRAVLLVGPLLLNGWSFPVRNPNLAYGLDVLAFVAVFGVCLAQIYLLLFNAPTRRLVHDLVFGSVVVRAKAADYDVPKVRAHAVVAAVLVLGALGLALAGPSLVKPWVAKIQSATAPQEHVRDAVNAALPEVIDTGVTDNTNTFYSGSGPAQVTRTLIVTAWVRKWPANVALEQARIGAVAVKSYHFAPGQLLTIKVAYGFDLGLGSYNRAEGDQFSTQCTTPDVKCLAK